LVKVNLPLLIGLLYFRTLKLITEQCTGTRPKSASDCRTDPGMTHCRANGSFGRGTSQGPDTGPFLSRRQ
jgi:hypothetical protein